MIRPEELRAIRDGDIDLAFRRWDRPRVRVGTRMRTAVGLVEVTSVDQVAPSRLTADDARRAGAASVRALQEALAHRTDRPVFRVGLRHAGGDPREALREQVPDDAELADLRAWLDRLDRSSAIGAWTRATLRIIDRSPGVRAPDLAAELGRPTPEFKRDVRKLKERGLTQSLDIGYRLSPRGAAVLGVPVRPGPRRHAAAAGGRAGLARAGRGRRHLAGARCRALGARAARPPRRRAVRRPRTARRARRPRARAARFLRRGAGHLRRNHR